MRIQLPFLTATFFCILGLIGSNLKAQTGFRIGIHLSPLYSKMFNKTDANSNKDDYTYDNTFGVAGGINLGYNFNSYMGLGIQMIYSSQGQHNYYFYLNEESKKVKVKNELRLRYFKIPLLFKLSTDATQKYSGFIELGPQIEFLTSVDERDTDVRPKDYMPPFRKGVYTNFPDRFNTFKNINFSGCFIVGLDIKLRYNLKMITSLRTDYTFNDVENKDAKYQFTNEGVTRNVEYYSQQTRMNFGPNRGPTNNLTIAATIGFQYIFLKKIDY